MITIFYSLIPLYIIFLLTKIINSTFTCSPEYFCDECQYCGEETMNFDSCFYYHIFCKENRNYLKYSPIMKEEYTDYFSLDPDIISFCGQEEYVLKNIEITEEKEIIIFSTKNKFFPKNKYMHCRFYIDLEKSYLLNPYLVFEKGKNSINPYNNGALKCQISNIFTYNNQVRSQSSKTISYNDILISSSDDIGTVLNLEIFVDFLDINYISPDEFLEIKITFDRKYTEEEVNANENLTENESSSYKTGTIAGLSTGGTIFIVVVICCCKNCGCCEKK